MATTWTELKQEVADNLHRTGLTSYIPTFISYAELRLAQDLRVPQLVARSTVTISAAGSSVAVPTGYIDMVSVSITNGAPLAYVTQDTYDLALQAGVTTPLTYTLIGSSIYVAPAWTAGGTLTCHYLKKQTALSGSTATNWYLDNAPQALLYAAMLEAETFNKAIDQEKLGRWKALYEYARDRVNDLYGVVDTVTRGRNLSSGGAKSLAPSV